MQQNLLQRAQAGLPLGPAERAIWKALKIIVPVGLVAALSVLSGQLVGGQPMQLGTLFTNCGTAFVVTVLVAAGKYWSAIQEPMAQAFGASATLIGDAIAKETGYNDVKQPAPSPAPVSGFSVTATYPVINGVAVSPTIAPAPAPIETPAPVSAPAA